MKAHNHKSNCFIQSSGGPNPQKIYLNLLVLVNFQVSFPLQVFFKDFMCKYGCQKFVETKKKLDISKCF